MNPYLLRPIRIALLALSMLCAASENVHGQIQWRISVKFILGASGQMPTNSNGYSGNSANLTNRQAVIDNINLANQLLDRTGRGFRFNLTEVQDVSGASGFFNLPARSEANKIALEAVANSNANTRAQFFWRDDAINVYINNTSSGVCSFVGSGNIIFSGSAAYDTLILHESGHFFDLFHTHQGQDFRNSNGTTCTASNACDCAQLIGGNNDNVADTVSDHQCWDRAALVANNPSASAFQIDNVWLNVMSYHLPQDRFTDDQMDRLTDTASIARNFVATGRTWFVDRNCGSISRNGSSRCDVFSGPFGLVRDGLNSAASGDIVLIRAGNYNERTVFNRPATLRASRGSVSIGIP
jgi:hypothetical protein